jgi:hypothetical protein
LACLSRQADFFVRVKMPEVHAKEILQKAENYRR